MKDDCEFYLRGQQFTLKGSKKVWSILYGRIPMLCRLNLVISEKITHLLNGSYLATEEHHINTIYRRLQSGNTIYGRM